MKWRVHWQSVRKFPAAIQGHGPGAPTFPAPRSCYRPHFELPKNCLLFGSKTTLFTLWGKTARAQSVSNTPRASQTFQCPINTESIKAKKNACLQMCVHTETERRPDTKQGSLSLAPVFWDIVNVRKGKKGLNREQHFFIAWVYNRTTLQNNSAAPSRRACFLIKKSPSVSSMLREIPLRDTGFVLL